MPQRIFSFILIYLAFPARRYAASLRSLYTRPRRPYFYVLPMIPASCVTRGGTYICHYFYIAVFYHSLSWVSIFILRKSHPLSYMPFCRNLPQLFRKCKQHAKFPGIRCISRVFFGRGRSCGPPRAKTNIPKSTISEISGFLTGRRRTPFHRCRSRPRRRACCGSPHCRPRPDPAPPRRCILRFRASFP